MIECLTSNFENFLSGTRYKRKIDVQGDYFQYSILENQRKSYGQIVNNLIAMQGRLTIKTNWDLDWKNKEYIVDNYGKKWQISQVVTMPQEVNSQVLAVMMRNPDTDYVLSLIEIQNMENLK